VLFCESLEEIQEVGYLGSMKMKKNVFHAFIVKCSLLITACLLFVNCDWDNTESNKQFIEYDLRGTWERDGAAFWPEDQTVTTEKGKLVLKYETIIITGTVTHLQGFTRNTVLEAYTEDSKLYIKDRGVWQSPISFILWESGNYLPDKMITLQGGSSGDETFKLISDLF
jgi:hypothetical protein